MSIAKNSGGQARGRRRGGGREGQSGGGTWLRPEAILQAGRNAEICPCRGSSGSCWWWWWCFCHCCWCPSSPACPLCPPQGRRQPCCLPERSFWMGVPVSSRRILQGRAEMAWLILDCPFCSQAGSRQGRAGPRGCSREGRADAAGRRGQPSRGAAWADWQGHRRTRSSSSRPHGGCGSTLQLPWMHAANAPPPSVGSRLEPVRLVTHHQLELLARHQGLVEAEDVVGHDHQVACGTPGRYIAPQPPQLHLQGTCGAGGQMQANAGRCGQMGARWAACHACVSEWIAGGAALLSMCST